MANPDEGQLTEDDLAKISAWIKVHAGDNPCPVCGHERWSIMRHLGALPTATKLGMQLGTYFPVVVTSCQKCGHFITFSAIAIGVASPASFKKGAGDGK